MSQNTKRVDVRSQFVFGGTRFSIRPVISDDIETLRRWKNARKRFFSGQEDITPEQQVAWWQGFSADPQQQMLVCTNPSEELVACVGFRASQAERLERPARPDELELFNLICGDDELLGTGLMKAFYGKIEAELSRQSFRAIYLCVLEDNARAIRWYEKRGYQQYGRDTRTLFLHHSLRGESSLGEVPSPLDKA